MDITGHPYSPYLPRASYKARGAAAGLVKGHEPGGEVPVVPTTGALRPLRRLLGEDKGAGVEDPMVMAASAAVGAAAEDESRLDLEIESNIRSVGHVLGEVQVRGKVELSVLG